MISGSVPGSPGASTAPCAVSPSPVAIKLAKSPKAAPGAAYALQAYQQKLGADAEKIPEQQFKADVARMIKLTEHMEKTWPKDNFTDTARHMLGVFHIGRKQFREAVAVLARVSDKYAPVGSLMQARYWWARAAREVLREELREEDMRFYGEQERKALLSMPELPAMATADAAEAYVHGQIQLCSLLYEAKDYDTLERQGASLQKRVAAKDIKLSPEQRDALERLQKVLETIPKK